MEIELLSANHVRYLVVSKIKMTSDKQRGKSHKTLNGGKYSKQVKPWTENSCLFCCSAAQCTVAYYQIIGLS